jgi:class 3 adenylate cyclase
LAKTPNLAARLQSCAGPDVVLIAESTHRIIAGLFEYRDLGAVELKGFVEPLRTWEVLGESRTQSRFEALRSGQDAARRA